MDSYTTIAHTAEAQLTEKRSRFLAFAHPIENEEMAKQLVAQYKKKYYDARHICYAYVIGNQGTITRTNDDGEPSGTAGRPILGQIHSFSLTYVIVVVVRYFGGVKLGTGPLGVAYKTVASEALKKAEKIVQIVKTSFRVSVPYTDADTAMRFIREMNAEITSREYTVTNTILHISVRCDDEMKLREKLKKLLTLRFLEKQ